MLTQKQHDLLMLIHDQLSKRGVPPSFEEMKNAIGLKSKSGIHRLIGTLEERGFIRRIPQRARAIEVLRLPSSVAPTVKGYGFQPSVIEGRLGQEQPQREAASAPDIISVPVMGRIAAGTPIEAIQHKEDELKIPFNMLGAGDHFGLVVRGDSMIEAGIFEDDLAIIKRTQSVSNGDIVVALIEREEATLKRFRRHGESVALEAANPNYPTRILGPGQLAIQGKLSMILRQY